MHKFILAIALGASIGAYALLPRVANAQSLSLTAQPLAGSEAISVSGTAPPGSTVTVTLLATISQDIPTIVVSRSVVLPDSGGNYQARIPIAAAYERGTILRVFATSSGQSSAAVQLIVGPPNGGVTVPLEQEPSGTHN